jgi:hypothetical protein
MRLEHRSVAAGTSIRLISAMKVGHSSWKKSQ